MRTWTIGAAAALLLAPLAAAQLSYETLSDPDRLLRDLPEWGVVADAYEPAVEDAVALLDWPDLRFDVYYGAWCEDSAREVPRLIRLAGIVGADVALMPVDRRMRVMEPGGGKAWHVLTRKTPTVFVWSGGDRAGTILETLEPTPERAVLDLLRARKAEMEALAAAEAKAAEEAKAAKAKAAEGGG